MNSINLVVLAGGTSTEREVSLGSGLASALALSKWYPTRLVEVTEDRLPAGLDPKRDVVFSTLHGGFGEDGGMQRALEEAGVFYAGCDAPSSALTMDKSLTKRAAAARGVQVAPEILFSADAKPTVAEVIAKLGDEVVFKPNDQGSSVGLSLVTGEAEIKTALTRIIAGNWLAEKRLRGRELSVGVLRGEAMGVVEIRPRSGVYDYESKYTKGATEYEAPAPIGDEWTLKVRRAAEIAFASCGCRDYARVDFIFSPSGDLFLLEINTLPGMKETSLLPMSARCVGHDFAALVKELVSPALQRLRSART